MEFRVRRLRAGEWLAAGSALALLVLLLALPWYGTSTGWATLPRLRWFALVTILAALALAFLQASRRAPAWPAAMSVIVTVLAFITVLWLAVDVFLNAQPHQRVWAYLGLVSACVLLCGSFRSLRVEGIAARDAPGEIPTVTTGAGLPS